MVSPVVQMRCGHCGEGVAGIVAGTVPYRFAGSAGFVKFIQCPLCQDGSVMAGNGVIYPPAPAGSQVRNLPADVDGAWREARTAHAVAAYTAAEIMCRKILMHVAVDVGVSKTGATFVQYVDELNKAGYITTGLKQAVDRIRNRGNVANHELPASSEEDSQTTIQITEHLLRGVYGLRGL